MTDYFWGPNPKPPPQPRQSGHGLGTAGKVLLITAAVVLVVGGLVLAGFLALLIVGLNSWGSNK